MVRTLSLMDRNRRTLEKLFVSHIADLARTNRKVDVFRDFLAMSAIALQNVALRSPDLEADYSKLIAKYGEKEQVEKEFSFLLALTVEALECDTSDFLGHVYMSQEMGIAEAGQFFTPSCLAKCIAQMNLDDAKGAVEQRGYLTVNDPACGGGVMLIAAVEEFQRQGLNHSQQICLYGEDIDITCVHMTYVQLSLLGVPAKVSHRNSLSMETWSVWTSPVWWLYGFEYREQRRRLAGECIEPTTKKGTAGDDAAAVQQNDRVTAPPAAESFTGRPSGCDVDLRHAKQADLFAM